MGSDRQRLVSVRVATNADLRLFCSEASPLELVSNFSSVALVFTLPETAPFSEVRRRAAEQLQALPTLDLRFWRWASRSSNVYRPAVPVLGETSLAALIRRGSSPPVVDLFLEQAPPGGHLPLYNPASDLLLFLKTYRGRDAAPLPTIEYSGHIVVPSDRPLAALLPKMRQMAGLPEQAEEQLELGEESKGGSPSLHRLLPGHTARAAQLQSGDILVLSLTGAKPSAKDFFACAQQLPSSPRQQLSTSAPPAGVAARAAAQHLAQLFKQAALQAEAALLSAADEAVDFQRELAAKEQKHLGKVAALEAKLQQVTLDAQQAEQAAEQRLRRAEEEAAAQLAAREKELQTAAAAAAATAEAALLAAAAEAAQLHRQLKEREAELHTAAAEAAQLDRQVKEREAALLAAAAEAAQLDRQLKEREAELHTAAAEAAQLDRQLKEREAELHTATAEATQLQRRLEEREAELHTLSQEGVVAAEAARAAAEDEAGKLRERLKALEAELAEAQEAALKAGLSLQFAQEEAEQLQKQLEKAEAEQARLQEALAAREAEQQQLEVATTKAREAEGEQLTQAKAALAAAAEEVARLQAELAARDRAHGERCDALQGQLAAATEEAAQARQELAAREELYEGRFQQVEGRLAAAAQAEGALQAAAAEAARLQQELVTREARYESRLRAMEAGQQLITKRLLVLEGDEEACGSLSTGGVQSLLRSLEASASRVRQLLADRQRADAQAQGGGVYRVPSQ
ncbi:hypothetical protein ABPG77_011216 [Micractinium sp. CCAP 211/92]